LSLYPLLLQPMYKEKVWGGRSLQRLGRSLPGGADATIGESWELADLAATSESGGGGAAAESRIRNGPLIKRTIGEVARDFGSLVTGSMQPEPEGRFPLLVKYLDARENLSVQVHPSPEYAAEHPDAKLKSEAWYVIAAEPGATIYKGIAEGTSPEAFQEALDEGRVDELLLRFEARPGDCHYLPSGTCHALGGGILVAEIQTPSDTTFRVWDWNRDPPRPLHREEAMACIEFGPARTAAFEPGTRRRDGGAESRQLVSCPHFAIREWRVGGGERLPFTSDDLAVLMCVEGGGRLSWGTEANRFLAVRSGDTVVLPAALTTTVLEADDPMLLLEISPPIPAQARASENGRDREI